MPHGPLGPKRPLLPFAQLARIPTAAGPFALLASLPKATGAEGTRPKFYMCTISGKQGGSETTHRSIVFGKGTQKRASEYPFPWARLQAPFARGCLNKFFLSMFKTFVG